MTAVTYHDFDTEAFNMDALGNRTGDQTLRDDGTVDFTVDSATNRYSSVGGNSISHDDAGNMTVDKDGYQYTYDYENRVVRIEDVNDVEVATHDYDALGRRIRVIDKSADPDVTTLYYYNPEWQVLAEYNGSNELQRYYVYGNYIDEPLVMHRESDDEDYYYAQDHLYSVVALIADGGSVVERYEYDAYGTVHIMDAGYNTRTVSSYGNPYAFTGRRLDVLDNGNLLSQHSRHRTYDTYAARFLQYDPLGYVDGMNLYLYAGNNPIGQSDPLGLMSSGGMSLEERAKAALQALIDWNTGDFGYRYYPLTGLKNMLEVTMMDVLDWVNYGSSSGATAAYRARGRKLMINIDEDQLAFGSYARGRGYVLLHETVHAFLHKNGLYQGDTLSDDMSNEGMAYATQYMTEAVESLRYTEDMIHKLVDTGELEWDESTSKRLEKKWAEAWGYINNVLMSTGQLNSGYDTIWDEAQDTYTGGEFPITNSHVRLVRKHLGFSISCSTIAAEYNDWVGDKLPCCRFTCKPYGLPGDISLKGMGGHLISTFK